MGFQVRFDVKTNSDTLIKVMTDGILLSEIQKDPFLEKYDTLIIDEVHERTLNIDFLLGYLKRLIQRRQDLKLIITSATIDVDRFSGYFSGAPIIRVSGKMYPAGYIFPLTRIIGAPEKYPENLSTSIVAEVMINLRSCRLCMSLFK